MLIVVSQDDSWCRFRQRFHRIVLHAPFHHCCSLSFLLLSSFLFFSRKLKEHSFPSHICAGHRQMVVSTWKCIIIVSFPTCLYRSCSLFTSNFHVYKYKGSQLVRMSSVEKEGCIQEEGSGTWFLGGLKKTTTQNSCLKTLKSFHDVGPLY